MPPEVVKKQHYTASVDIWSAGVLLYFITVGHLPFEGDTLTNVFEKIVYSDPFIPPFISPGLSDLLKKMLTKQPEDRITIDKIKKHEWFPTADFLRIKKICGQINSQNNTNSIDNEIIEKMEEIGIDTNNIKQSLILKNCTDSTAVYHMLEREKLIESLKGDLKLIQCLRFEQIKKVSSVAIGKLTIATTNNTNTNDGTINVRPFLSPKILSRNNSKLNIQKRFSHDILHFSKNGNKSGL